MRILVADDEEMKRVSLAQDLAEAGHEVTTCADGSSAWASLRRESFDAVIADLRMPGLDGLQLLERSRAEPGPGPEFVVITAYGSIPVAVEAMQRGAFDFVTKPFDNEQLLPILRRIEQKRCDRQLRSARPPAGEDLDLYLIGDSAPMRRVKQLVGVCAATDSNVLLCGETGTGKDLIASVVHKCSRRRGAPFVKVCCAVFPRELVASELYGHEKGAFTGAEKLRSGRFDLAMGGTLYLDDIDDIPYDEQIKLLRVIEERVFERVGGSAPVKADVRIIASTKRDLLQRCREGAFREDLFYRLNVLRIDVPPLRERLADLPLLVRHHLERIAGGQQVGVTPAAMDCLRAHAWPGNVRELANALERAFLLGRGSIGAEDLVLGAPATEPAVAPGSPAAGLDARMTSYERDLLVRALAATQGNKTAAARLLGLKPSTLRDHLARHDL
jgi:DNA-binding NtrC family response regulator